MCIILYDINITNKSRGMDQNINEYKIRLCLM